MTISAHRWQNSLASWLDAAPLIPYSLYTSCKKSFMPSTRHCTWPLSIWKRHLIYPDMSSGGLFASSALRNGCCSSYRACMIMPEAECVLVATRMNNSLPKWLFTKALPSAPPVHHGSESPSPKNFVQDIPGKICMQMTWPSLLTRWRNYKRSWSSGRPTWKEMHFGSTWANPWSWYLSRSSMCFRSLAKTLWHVCQRHRHKLHKLHFLLWLFQLGPQEMQ